MGAVQLSAEIQEIIESKVRDGRADSSAALVEEAVLRLLEEDNAYDNEIGRIIDAGIADADAGRYVTIATNTDAESFLAQTMERVRAGLTAET